MPQQQRARPIDELPIPADVQAAGRSGRAPLSRQQRLAYQLEAPVNWCPALGTVLSNEEVKDGLSERGGHPVVRIPLRQWMLRITAYAERLENDLEPVDWSEGIKALQRNWIGRSAGAEVDFFIGDGITADDAIRRLAGRIRTPGQQARAKSGFPRQPGDDVLRIYTTRPDTLFGATYMVIAPEHPQVERLTTAEQHGASASLSRASMPAKAISTAPIWPKPKPASSPARTPSIPSMAQPVPIWVADYVLMGYGTGAIMAVPAHDTRDFEFAKQFGLPIKAVVDPGTAAQRMSIARPCSPAMFPSPTKESRSTPAPTTACRPPTSRRKSPPTWRPKGVGRAAVNYKLRDWLFSRQHFWGEPFPILHELDADGEPNGLIRALAEKDLPLDLPEMKHFKPHGRPEPPLEEAPHRLALSGHRRREVQARNEHHAAMGRLVLVLLAVHRSEERHRHLIDPALEKAWMPVDLYIGGAEHAVLAPAVLALLAQGALRPEDRQHARAVHEAGEPGNDPGRSRDHRLSGRRLAGGSARTMSPTAPRAETLRKSTGGEVRPLRVPQQQAQKQGESFVLVGRPEHPSWKAARTRCRRAAATSSILTRWSPNMAPIRCGCTRCSWARSKP